MTPDKKRALAKKLLADALLEESDYTGENDFQGSDFENPFNTAPPRVLGTIITADVGHVAALSPDKYKEVTLKSVKTLGDGLAEFRFCLPEETNHTGCNPGQYIQVRVQSNGGKEERHMSPVSSTKSYGIVDLVLKFESYGKFSKHFKSLPSGECTDDILHIFSYSSRSNSSSRTVGNNNSGYQTTQCGCLSYLTTFKRPSYCNHLLPGAKIDMRGPCGGFEYAPNSTDHLSLITSGVGATPAIQIVREIISNREDNTSVSYVHFSKTDREILYYDELQSYANDNQNFRLHLTVEEGGDKWKGEEGFIEEELLERSLPKPGEKKHQIVVCGGPAMVMSTLEYLRRLGHPSESIYVYGQFGVNQIRSVYGKGTRLSSHCLTERFS